MGNTHGQERLYQQCQGETRRQNRHYIVDFGADGRWWLCRPCGNSAHLCFWNSSEASQPPATGWEIDEDEYCPLPEGYEIYNGVLYKILVEESEEKESPNAV